MIKDQKKDGIRLNVYLQRHGVASRRKADELIKNGVVRVDDRIVKELGFKVEKGSKVSVDGKPLRNTIHKMTYLFYKPDMTITSRKDEQGRETIFSLPQLKSLPANVQSVGRLDYRSEGLLVLTNDGDLALALSHPKYSVEKTYAVLISTLVTPEELEKLRKGVELDDGLARAIAVRTGNKERLGNSMGQWVEISVTEGRNRLIRRMFESLGLRVSRLVRIAIGDLRLPSALSPGELRPLTTLEEEYLKNIKDELLRERKEIKGIAKKPPSIPQTVLENRRLKRKITLNNAEYAQEIERRRMRASQLARQRRDKLAEEKSDEKKIYKKDQKASSPINHSTPKNKTSSTKSTHTHTLTKKEEHPARTSSPKNSRYQNTSFGRSGRKRNYNT